MIPTDAASAAGPALAVVAREESGDPSRVPSSHRGDDRIADRWAPRGAAAWALGLYVAAACALAYPAFGGGFLAPPGSDQYLGAYAVREFGTAMLRAGHLPAWNPYLFGGMPFVGAFDGDVFYPPTVAMRLVMPSDVAITWAFVVHVILAGWLAYGWLRTTGLGFPAATIGGLAYEMSGPIASYASPGHDGKLYVSALLPLALWLVVRGVRDGRRWSWPALAGTVGLAALTPHPQLLQYLLLTTGAYALALAYPLIRSAPRATAAAARASPRIAVQRLGAALGATMLGLVMAAVQYLPVAEFVAWSPRGSRATGAGTYAYATQFSMPIEDLPNVYLPQFTGLFGRYWGGLGSHWHSEYLGASVLVLAGAALAVRPRDRWPAIRFWLGVALVGTLWSLGGRTPLYHIVYALVPGTAYFRVPAAAFVVVALAVAALAADGVACLLRREVRVRYAIACCAAAACLAIPGVLHSITGWVAHHFGAPWTPGQAEANLGQATAGALRCLVIVGLTAAVIAARRDARLSVPVASAALALLVALDLGWIERQYWRFSRPAAQTFAADAAIDSLRRAPEPVRVLAWSLGHRFHGIDPELGGNTLMIHRIRQVLGYHGNEIRRYDALSWTGDGTKPLYTPHFWQLLNVGYLLTDTAALPFAGGTLVVGPVRDAAGDSVYLYRLAGPHPAAWLAAAATSLPDTFAILAVTDPRFDLEHLAVTEPAARQAAPDSIGPPPAIPVTARQYDPGHLRFALARPAPAGTTLVVSENYYPGWTATADGQPVPVWRADFALIGVPLPAGTREVELRFASASLMWGAALSALAVLGALAWLVAARRGHAVGG